MPDSPTPSADSNVTAGYTPSYAQDYSNLANPYAFQASGGNNPFLIPEFYGPFYPHSFVQSPYAIPFVFQDPFLGQPFDLRNLYGPFTSFAYGPYGIDPSSIAAAQGDISANSNGMNSSMAAQSGENAYASNTGDISASNGASMGSPSGRAIALASVPRTIAVPVPSQPIQHIHHVSPIHTTQTVQSSQPMQPVQTTSQPQPIDASIGSQTTAQESTSTNQSNSSRPSVQVVVQPSQPIPQVQSQRSTSAPQPAVTTTPIQQMPTAVMQTVPQMGQPYNSGYLYPPQSSPFFNDEYSGYDPYLATGGRIAGSIFLGLLSIPFSVFAPLGFLFSLVGLRLANSYMNNGGGRGVGNLARFFNVIGLILTVACTAAVALYVGYSAGQGGFLLFGQDPIEYINNSEPMKFLFEQWSKLKEFMP